MAATSASKSHTMKTLFVVLVVVTTAVILFYAETYNKSISSTVSRWTTKIETVDVMRCFADEDGKPFRDSLLQSHTDLADQDKVTIEKNLVWLDSLNASDSSKHITRATQISRMSHIVQVCKTVPRMFSRFGASASFVEIGNTTFCLIPKTGTTNLLRKLCIMIGPACGDRIVRSGTFKLGFCSRYKIFPARDPSYACKLTKRIDANRVKLKHLLSFLTFLCNRFGSYMSKEQLIVYTDSEKIQPSASQKLSSPTIAIQGSSHKKASVKKPRKFLFTIVRDPWQRLVSTYIQKFLFSNQYMVQCGVKGQWAEFNKITLVNGSRWTFRDFIEKCVIHQYDRRGMSGMNSHWRPQFVEGAFCDVHYNFIAKLESFSQDEPSIIKQFNPTTDVEQLNKAAFKYRRANEKSGSTSKSYTDYWRTIEPALMERLIQIYNVDTLMFEYKSEPLDDS